jgi:Ferredoxin subunits of nitrite reductase and ring-hydroxylating dioxygenases
MKKIAEINQIPPGRSKLVMVNDKPVALFNINGKIFAWDNRCPHRGASLSDGNISENGNSM